MPLEIERKFLVASDGWREDADGGQRLRDGLLSSHDGCKVRVRTAGDRAWITVKGPRIGIVREEYEYPIPTADAELMLATLSVGPVVEKVRFRVPFGGLVWEVDLFEGILAGTVFAEVELSSPDQDVPMPGWVGREVTGDAAFSKVTLLKAACEREPERRRRR